MEHTKICNVCKLEKQLEDFPKRKGKPDYRCKECTYTYNKEYYKRNQKKIKQRTVDFRKNQPEYMVKWRQENKEKLKNQKKDWVEKNRDKINQNERKRRKEDKAYKIKKNLRRRTNLIIVRGGTKSMSTIQLLGCTADQIFIHLENLFTKGMTWENYGNNGWHIDHIIPCSNFDLTKPEQQMKCFHYTNLQPLWAEDNIRKGNKIPVLEV